MDLSNTRIFSAMQQKMAYLGERQAVLAQNIANADTPGYTPLDLKKVNFNAMVNSASGLKVSTTNPKHLAMSGHAGKFATENQPIHETTPSGNSVVVEDQLFKMSETAMDYQATTSLYKKMTRLMDLAITGGR